MVEGAVNPEGFREVGGGIGGFFPIGGGLGLELAMSGKE